MFKEIVDVSVLKRAELLRLIHGCESDAHLRAEPKPLVVSMRQGVAHQASYSP